MSAPNMKSFYCHECGKNFVLPDRSEPSCIGCGSEFVELLDNTEESRSVGGANLAATNLLLDPFSIVTTSSTTTTPRTATTEATSGSATTGNATARSTTATATTATSTTTTTTTSGSTTGSATATPPSASRAPINITIGSNPIFRRGFFPPFTAGGSGSGAGLDGRESPMDTAANANSGDEDPGDEVLSAAQLRRRNHSHVRGSGNGSGNGSGGGGGATGHSPSIGLFPGGMFMVSQSPRGGGLGGHSLGEMIQEHIQNVMAQVERENADGTDGGQQSQQSQQEQQQQQQQEQQQQEQQPASPWQQQFQQHMQQQRQQHQQQHQQHVDAALGEANRRSNVRVINFPIMMPRPSGSGQQQQQQAAGAAGAAGSSNPQLPQFGMPMFFGLPLGRAGGLHGSPSDYAWGPQGLENIISQMLANLEDDGPPPTKKEKLDSLPTICADAEDLKECSLCSVCKDDFTVGENLLKLPCSHLYHKDCAMPWLEMHDTCPTCRFHINTGKYDEDRIPQ